LTSGKKPLKYITCVVRIPTEALPNELYWNALVFPQDTNTHTHAHTHVYRLFINFKVTTNNTILSFKEIKKIRNNF